MFRSSTGPSKRITPFSASKWRVIAILLAAISLAGADFVCPGEGGPCADGWTGDRLDDFNSGDAVAVTLTNRSNDYVHMISEREEADLCNRVDDLGGNRSVFVPNDRLSYRVRAYRNGVLIDSIVCELGEVNEVVFTGDDELICVDFGG
jgi:hypothetical protein